MDTPSAFPPLHIISPTSDHTHTIIFLHGRGSNGPEFAEDLMSSESSQNLFLAQHFPALKWIFPSSQERYSTVFQERMDEWFDIYSLDNPSAREELQVEGLQSSVRFVQGIIKEEAKLVPYDRIILGGISQGCATSITTLLASPNKLGAYIGISGWMPFRARIEEIEKNGTGPQLQSRLHDFYKSTLGLENSAFSAESSKESTSATPVFLGHASDDEVIDIKMGKEICRVLEGLGMKVSWNEYGDCGHWFKEPQEFDDIISFLQEQVNDMK